MLALRALENGFEVGCVFLVVTTEDYDIVYVDETLPGKQTSEDEVLYGLLEVGGATGESEGNSLILE